MNKTMLFKYRTSFRGNIEAFAPLPTFKLNELRKLLEDGVIPHKDKLYYPALAYGSVVLWSYNGVNPKTNKKSKIVGCLDTIINEVSIEYLDGKESDVNDPFKSSRRNPKSTKVKAEEQVILRPEAVREPEPDLDEDDIPF